jgi:hypothetical protein
MVQRLIYFLLISICFSQCVHDLFSSNTTKHFYEDFEGRVLQTSDIGK